MDQWTPVEDEAEVEVEAHIGFMNDFAARLADTGEYVDGQERAIELAGDDASVTAAVPGTGPTRMTHSDAAPGT